jgi:hypothetical protein
MEIKPEPEPFFITPESIEDLQLLMEMANGKNGNIRSTMSGKLLADKYGFSYRRWRKGTIILKVNFSALRP